MTRQAFEGALWVALAAGTIAALALAASTPLAEMAAEQALAPFFWRWISVAYSAVALAAMAVVWGVGLCLPQTKRQPILRWGVRGLAAVALVLAVAANWQAVASIPDRLGGWALAATLAAVVALLGSFSGRPAVQWTTRGAVIGALVTAWMALSTGSSRADVAAVELPQNAGSGERLLVLGLDGADWRFLDRMVAAGELPNLQALRERGIWGPLSTLKPTQSPRIWTTVVTGRHPRDHGVLGHVMERPRNAYAALPELEPGVRYLGVPWLVEQLRRTGRIVRSPATSIQRQVPAYWDIATKVGLPVDVHGWWATWPAEAILGRMVSDRAFFWRWSARGMADVGGRETFPEAFLGEIESLLMAPDEVRYEHALEFMDVSRAQFETMMNSDYRHHDLSSEFKYYYSMFRSNRAIALRLARTQAKDSDLLALFRVIDYACHSSLRFSELVDKHLRASAEDLQKYGAVVSNAYRAADAVVGEMVEAFGPGNVIVLSDHGFALEGRRYNHRTAPPGIFLAAGPAFGQGRVDGLSVLDVLPILLAAKGLPVAADLERPVDTRVFAEGFLEANPVALVPTFGRLEGERTEVPEGEEEMLERLRALGYIE